jgi:hypothetical protein
MAVIVKMTMFKICGKKVDKIVDNKKGPEAFLFFKMNYFIFFLIKAGMSHSSSEVSSWLLET